MDFPLFLLILLIVTGIAWGIYWGFYRRKYPVNTDEKAPWWYEYCGSFFIVILVVFVVRSFIVEPFSIHSSSMVPTLLTGDYILTNKFAYGIRLPVINKKIIDIGSPKRGDIVVFQYPEDPSINYIKRVIGLPGDIVDYHDKILKINGKVVEKTRLNDYLNEERFMYSEQYQEQLEGVSHRVLNDPDRPAGLIMPHAFPNQDKCRYDQHGFICTVPDGHYFMMGDNRDNSSDSRVWGFVEDRRLVGKAFIIWFHMNDFSRIGSIK